ncbi:facilitated trehalose transporter Tret1-like [Leptopilina heterotoma]|uniref:facilitated trehalose transporter Tret1-like n=1 Tax=Leptopilina heterotoma TaxID=63436 RepID=UPI001CA95E24|nr:facilitated trehalose transporter Tret1-like [Leptopilina heterotoma]
MYSESKSVEAGREPESNVFQYICTICVSFAVAGGGTFVVWTSSAFVYYESSESEISVTKFQASWIYSIFFLGVIAGCLVVPFMIDRLGRKKLYLLFSLFQVIGWILIIFARDYIIICLGRVCHGLAECALFDFISVYIAEIAEKRIRGKLGTMLKVAAFTGIFYAGCLGAFVSYQTMNLMCLLMPLMFLSTFPFMPESPYFCLMEGRDEEAGKILMKLRGVKNIQSVDFYIQSMKIAIVESKERGNSFFDMFASKSNWKCLLILFLAKGTKMLSGNSAMAGYTQNILSASGFELDPKFCAVIIYGFLLLASVIAVTFIDKVNRRTLFLSTGIICTGALTIIGFYFYLKDETTVNVSSFSWITMSGIILYYFSYCSGIGPISYIIAGELFPINVKGFAVNLGIIMENLCGFIIGIGFNAVNILVGHDGTFAIFALFCILGSIGIFFTMPETRGRSLEEIQTELERNGKK